MHSSNLVSNLLSEMNCKGSYIMYSENNCEFLDVVEAVRAYEWFSRFLVKIGIVKLGLGKITFQRTDVAKDNATVSSSSNTSSSAVTRDNKPPKTWLENGKQWNVVSNKIFFKGFPSCEW